MSDDPRARLDSLPDSPAGARSQLSEIAASLRAYLEWQQDSGAMGIPRRPKASANVAPAREPPPAPEPPPAREPQAPPPSTRALEPEPERVAPPPMPSFDAPAAKPAVAKAPAPPPAEILEPAEVKVRLETIRNQVAGCKKCGLAETRKQTVFSRGNPEAKLCFIGEAPGADEDEQGLPFVGRAGQLLDKMIGAMGLSPERDVYVCNIIKCRPPGNRRPTPEETEACIPYLHEQLALIRPRVIVALGNTAVGTLLGTSLGISKIRGQWKLYKGQTLVMPTYHPSFLLRPSPQQAEAKREAWEDLQSVMKELGLTLPKR